MRAGGRQPEDIGGHLHGGIALRAAAGDAHLGDRHPAAFFDAFRAFAQGVGQPFQDGPVQMRSRVHVAEADDGAFGFRAGVLQPRRPVGLEHQPHRAGRDLRFTSSSNSISGFDALLVGLQLLRQAELLLEPAHHPVAAEDLNFQAVGAGHGRRVGRDQRDDLDVLAVRGVDRGRGAVAQAADVRVEAARADHLAGFVRGRGDQRQPGGDPGRLGGLRA